MEVWFLSRLFTENLLGEGGHSILCSQIERETGLKRPKEAVYAVVFLFFGQLDVNIISVCALAFGSTPRHQSHGCTRAAMAVELNTPPHVVYRLR